ncbi:MAG: cytochrome bd-I oxidase subunit CydX [Pseudomonadota bacterium]
MWYFSWILGLGLAVAFGILNGLWHEYAAERDQAKNQTQGDDGAAPRL